MRYFVTGGSGFIGSAVVKRLVADGCHVTVLDNNSRGRADRLAGVMKNIEFIEGDARDAAAVTRASKGTDWFIHLAAVNGTENFYIHPELVLDVGVRGMLAAVDACRANGIRNLVVASSSEAYQTPPQIPTPENIPLVVPDILNPRYSYCGSKILSELVAMNYGRTGFDRVMIVRPHNVYGPDMGWEHVLPQLAVKALAEIDRYPDGKIHLKIRGSGTQTRAFVHIDDFVDGLSTVISKGSHLQVYHIGTQEEISIFEVARKILSYFGRDDAQIVVGDDVPGEPHRRCPDISKLKTLGYMPSISFDAGLPSLADWYRANRHLQPVRG